MKIIFTEVWRKIYLVMLIVWWINYLCSCRQVIVNYRILKLENLLILIINIKIKKKRKIYI